MNCPALAPEFTRAMPRARTADVGRPFKGRRGGAKSPALLLFLILLATAIAGTQTEDTTAWVCPMHSDYTSEVQGTCPRCGMALVHAAPFDVRDYRLDFRTVPAVVRPGQKVSLLFRILKPGTSEVVKKFEVVHERQYHLFLISQDMEYFQHIHPRELADGTWTIDVTLPKPGYYKVLSDFLPSGGASQFIARPLVTAGYAGDLEADSAHLVPDTVSTKVVDDITATIDYDPPVFAVGQYGHMNFHLKDTATGQPVADLQTYL